MTLEDVQLLAEMLIERHLPNTRWSFNWNRQTKGFGLCKYSSTKITLSERIQYETEDAIEQTILHEIAHALAGPGHRHNKVWKQVARSIGVRNPRATRAPTCEPHNKPEPVWVMIVDDEIINEYHRRPSKNTFRTIHTRYIPGRNDTKGKLQLVSYEDYKNGIRKMPAVVENTKIEPTWVMVHKNRIVKRYYRKPNRKTFLSLETMYIRGQRLETQGKLQIVPYTAYLFS